MFIILFSRIFKCKNSSLKGNENILIDIFITSENLTTDRYYNKLEKKKNEQIVGRGDSMILKISTLEFTVVF